MFSYIFATPKSRYGRFTLAMAYNTRTGCIQGLLLDARSIEIKDFKDKMGSMKQYSSHPLLAPAVLVEACTRLLASRLRKLNAKLGKTRFDNYMTYAATSGNSQLLEKVATDMEEWAKDVEKTNGSGVGSQRNMAQKMDPISTGWAIFS